MLLEEGGTPVGHHVRMCEHLKDASDRHDDIETQVHAHKDRGDVDRFIKAFEENRAKNREQDEGHGQLAMERARGIGVVDEVGRRVGGRESHGDDEVGGRESEQYQDKEFAAPSGEEVLKHGDASLPIGAGGGDAFVDGKGGKQRDQNEDKRSNRREDSGGEESDAGLVAEGGEVVHPGETHHAPPGVIGAISVFFKTLRELEVRKEPVC